MLVSVEKTQLRTVASKILYFIGFLLIFTIESSANDAFESAPEVGVTPEWFSDSRIHAHTRLAPLAWKRMPAGTGLEHFLFDRNLAWERAYNNAESALAEMGVSVFTRHGKTMDEEPWWPSSMPINSNGPIQSRETEDLITPFTARAIKAGVKVLVYYWDNSDTLSLSANPEWVCKDKDGRVIGHSVKGPHLDISSEYGDVVKARLRELKDRGASGIYLDWRHFPPTGCFGTHLEKNFRHAHPEFASLSSQSRTFWNAFQLYQAKTMAEVIKEWADLFRHDPDFAFVTSVTSLPNLINREMTFDLARTGIPKTEFHVATKRGLMNYIFQYNPDLYFQTPSAEARMAFGWSILRSVSQSTPHVWINGVPTSEQLMLSVGAVVGHGGIANVDIDERNITQASDEEGVTPRAALEEIYSLNSKIGPLFRNAKPLDYVAVHFSESERNKYGRRGSWVEVASPVISMFETLLAAGVPVTGIDDRILTEGDLSAYRYIVSPTLINESVLLKLTERNPDLEYVHIKPFGSSFFGREKYYSDNLAKIIDDYKSSPDTVKYDLRDKDDHVVVWEDSQRDRLIVSIVKPFAEVQTGSRTQPATKPYFSLPAKEHGDSHLTIESMRFKNKRFCAQDAITGIDLDFDGRNISIPGPMPWRLVEVKPCLN